MMMRMIALLASHIILLGPMPREGGAIGHQHGIEIRTHSALKTILGKKFAGDLHTNPIWETFYRNHIGICGMNGREHNQAG